MSSIQSQIEDQLRRGSNRDAGLQQVLHLVLAEFQSETGTIHRLDPERQQLHLLAQIGLPPALMEVVRQIPVGKGIAGQTVARGGPVSICNLQTDSSGTARPGARQTGVGGALCVPLRAGETIVGTLGVGTIRQYEYTADQARLLEDIGRIIGAGLSETGSPRAPATG